MKTLTQILLAEPHKDAVLKDFVELIEKHVASRGGLKGMGLRAGLKMLKAAKPGVMDRATAKMLPDFLAALEPLHQKFEKSPDKAKKEDFAAFLKIHEKQAASALLDVADSRAEAGSETAQSYYSKFRGSGDDVKDLVAPMGKLIARYM